MDFSLAAHCTACSGIALLLSPTRQTKSELPGQTTYFFTMGNYLGLSRRDGNSEVNLLVR